MFGNYSCTKWQCSKCSLVNEGNNVVNCRKCCSPKELGVSLQVLPGDWACTDCGINNFQKRFKCFKCGCSKAKKARVMESGMPNCSNEPNAQPFVFPVLCEDSQPYVNSNESAERSNDLETQIVPDSFPDSQCIPDVICHDSDAHDASSDASTLDPNEFLEQSIEHGSKNENKSTMTSDMNLSPSGMC